MSETQNSIYKPGTYRDYLDFNKSSKFWLGADTYNSLQSKYGKGDVLNLEGLLDKVKILHTISNFIKIISETKTIEVTYAGAQSSTDGKKITVSADVKDFDFVCGQAMHEAGHVLHSQELLAWLANFVNDYINKEWKANHPVLPSGSPIDSIFDRFRTREYKEGGELLVCNSLLKTFEVFKNILNWVEDRRIDELVISKYPGYKGYYDSVKIEGLWNPKIEKEVTALKGKETWGSYLGYLFSLMSENPDLDALKGLRKISNIIDLKNISRLKKRSEILAVVVAVFKEIEKNVAAAKPESKPEKKEKSKKESKPNESEHSEPSQSDPDDESENSEPGETEDSDENESETEDSETEDSENEETEDSNNETGDTEDDSEDEENESNNNTKAKGEDTEADEDDNTSNAFDEENDPDVDTSELGKRIEKALNITNGETQKTELTSTEQNVYGLLNNKAGDYYWRTTDVLGKKFNVIVIERMTENIVKTFPEVFEDDLKLRRRLNEKTQAIESGINKGKSLASKLMLTNDDKLGFHSRKKSGYIDTRILSEIPSGNVKIFRRKFVDIQEKTYLHITLDSSGSMGGDNWYSALEMAAMFASASKLLKNLEVEVTCRSTISLGGGEVVYILKMFDSEIHDLAYLRKWWLRVTASNNTPEGLAFNAIAEIIKKRAKDKNKIFVNVSDGCPGCYDYHGPQALNHTKKVVENLRQDGFVICSYLLGANTSSTNQFKTMYGNKDSYPVEKIEPLKIAHTINPYLMS